MSRTAAKGGRYQGADRLGDDRAVERRRLSFLVDAFLAVPLRTKILIGNALITAAVGAAALELAGASFGSSDLRGFMLFVTFAVLLSAGLNGVMLRWALEPLDRITDAAERVSRGEDARAPRSRLADASTATLVQTFNEMLDRIDDSRRRQRSLAGTILETEAHERARISREIYDGPAQTLATVLIRLRIASRGVDLSAVGTDGIEEIRDGVAGALDDLRRLARRLQPPELAELGVRSAVEAYARRLTEDRSARITVAGVPPRAENHDAEIVLYRVLREAVERAVLHSRSERVDIRFRMDGDALEATVSDDSGGFDDGDGRPGSESTYAYAGMEERASYVGGSVRVDSTPGRGTSVEIRLPWQALATGTPSDSRSPQERREPCFAK